MGSPVDRKRRASVAGRVTFASLVFVGGLVIAACGGGSNDKPTDAGDDVPHVTIYGRDLRFEPSDLRLKAGQPVRITFVNDGSVEHDLSIPGLNSTGNVLDADHGAGHDGPNGHMHDSSAMAPGTVHMAVSPGEEVEVEFTPAAGTFDMLCTYPGHREAGMMGKVVSE